MAKCKRGVEQLELQLPSWGGARKGAGRRRASARPRVAHVERQAVHRWNPLLVTMRVREDVPDLRDRSMWVVAVRALRSFRGTTDVAFVHYSVQRNHLHLIGESRNREELAHGMQSFCTRLAKAINARCDRRGTVFDSRYHARELTTPTEVRNALRYVLLNARHHEAEAGRRLPSAWLDPRSTASTFDGWTTAPQLPERDADFGSSPAQSWLLRCGWRRHGLLSPSDLPGEPMLRSAGELASAA